MHACNKVLAVHRVLVVVVCASFKALQDGVGVGVLGDNVNKCRRCISHLFHHVAGVACDGSDVENDDGGLLLAYRSLRIIQRVDYLQLVCPVGFGKRLRDIGLNLRRSFDEEHCNG